MEATRTTVDGDFPFINFPSIHTDAHISHKLYHMRLCHFEHNAHFSPIPLNAPGPASIFAEAEHRNRTHAISAAPIFEFSIAFIFIQPSSPVAILIGPELPSSGVPHMFDGKGSDPFGLENFCLTPVNIGSNLFSAAITRPRSVDVFEFSISRAKCSSIIWVNLWQIN